MPTPSCPGRRITGTGAMAPLVNVEVVLPNCCVEELKLAPLT